MTDQPTDADKGPDDNASSLSGWGVIAGVLTLIVMSPFVFLASLQGGWLGPIAVLVAVVGFVAFLMRSGQRSLGFGIAAGYVLITVVTGGICTGWNQAIL